MSMRRVVVRSSGIGSSKRAWMQPPSEVEHPQAEQANRLCAITSDCICRCRCNCHCCNNNTNVGAPAASTPEPAINPGARVGDSSGKPSGADVEGPRYYGQCPWGALGGSTYGMPKSVNKTVLAPGGRAEESDSKAAVSGLGNSKMSPKSQGR